MTSKQRQDFLSYQQGELDAVLMYKSFAELTDNEELKAVSQVGVGVIAAG